MDYDTVISIAGVSIGAGDAMNLGISGRLTRALVQSPLTPLLLLASLAMGLIALSVP